MDIVEGADPPLRWFARRRRRPSATSTTPGPTRCARSRRSSSGTSVTFALCDLSPTVRGQLDAYGLTEKIGAERIFASLARGRRRAIGRGSSTRRRRAATGRG